MVRPYISLLIVFAVLSGGVHLYLKHKPALQEVFTKEVSQIESIGMEDNIFIIRGIDLSTVELWVVPTGTEIDEEDNMKIGNAYMRLKSELGEVWAFPVPREPLLVTEIYAKGYDKKGREVGKVLFPIVGATDIYNALWANAVGDVQEEPLAN